MNEIVDTKIEIVETVGEKYIVKFFEEGTLIVTESGMFSICSFCIVF